MPSVIDINETLTEIQELPTYKTLQPAPQRTGLAAKITAALKGMRRSERSAEHIDCYPRAEMPLDILARKHPYMYADALLG